MSLDAPHLLSLFPHGPKNGFPLTHEMRKVSHGN